MLNPRLTITALHNGPMMTQHISLDSAKFHRCLEDGIAIHVGRSFEIVLNTDLVRMILKAREQSDFAAEVVCE